MPRKLERCVKAIKKQNKGNRVKYNPYAVCKASIYGKKKRKIKI